MVTPPLKKKIAEETKKGASGKIEATTAFGHQPLL